MKPKTLCLLALLTCLTGCMPLDSLSPLYTEKDIVVDKTLLGDWVNPNKEEDGATLSFATLVENGKDTGYSVTMSGKRGDGSCSAMEFYGHEVEIGGNKYLDLVVRNWDASTQAYPLQITQSKKGAIIAPAFLRLGTASYLEFKGGKQVVAHLHTAHWFARITRDGDKLRLDWIDDELFRKAVAAGKFHLAHLMLGPKKQDVVVTASTSELQKFIAEHGNDADLFTEHTSELQKKSE